MSISDQRRIGAKKVVLTMMLDTVGDQFCVEIKFKTEHPAFAEVPMTTWRELMDEHMVKSLGLLGALHVTLTPFGWLNALQVSGHLSSEDTRQRCTKLVQALKKVVKGREHAHDALSRIDVVATDAGLPMGWVYNAIASYLLTEVFPNNRWDVTIDGNTIRVSPTFGLNWIAN